MSQLRTVLAIGGALIGALLFVIATAMVPGGYDWVNHSISSVFQPQTMSGKPNDARPIAAFAILVCCASIAVVFHAIAQRGPTRFHTKTIQIAGIGSMVYAGLVITPMHNVLVGVALLFFIVATATLFHRLFGERRYGMLAVGILCLTLTVGNAMMYYGGLFDGFLPVVQKLSLSMWLMWLLVQFWRDARARPGERAA